MTEMVEFALGYARRGWPVFPCDPATKRPLIKDGFKGASTDEATVVGWWQRWPNAMIGVPMGRATGVFAIDPDVPKEFGGADGLAAWHDLVRQNGGSPPTHTQETPSGGLHILFRWDEQRPITNREGDLPPGINVRGEGGYIIAEPSRRADGVAYRMVEPLDRFNFASAPEWLYELLLAERLQEPESAS